MSSAEPPINDHPPEHQAEEEEVAEAVLVDNGPAESSTEHPPPPPAPPLPPSVAEAVLVGDGPAASSVEPPPTSPPLPPPPSVEEALEAAIDGDEGLSHLQRFYKTLYGGISEDTIQWAKSCRHVSQDDWNRRVHILRHWDSGYDGLDKQAFRSQNRAGYNWSRDFHVAEIDSQVRLLSKANNRLCVPIGEVFAAIAQYHDINHKGEHKTYSDVSEKYCNISREQVKAYIQTCPVCQVNRKRRTMLKREDVPVPASIAAAYDKLEEGGDEGENPDSDAMLAQHREAFESMAIRQFDHASPKSTNKQLSPAEMRERIHVMSHWDTGADGLSMQSFRRQHMPGYVWNQKFRIHGNCLALRETGRLYIATDQIFDAIKKSHYTQRHAGLHTTYAHLCETYGNITRQLVSAFIKTCPVCATRKRGSSSLSTDAFTPQPKKPRAAVLLPSDHPIHAYVDDARALVHCLLDEPTLLHCKELSFLKDIVNEERLVSKSMERKQANATATHLLVVDDVRTIEPVSYLDVVIIGAGAAGIGLASALLLGGLDPRNLLILEQGPSLGTSFRQWHSHTQFISPSWPTYPFGPQDLNAIVPDTTIFKVHASQHPTGVEFAEYLQDVAPDVLPVKFNCYVSKIEIENSIFRVFSGEEVILSKHAIWCGGEWSYPRPHQEDNFQVGSFAHYRHVDLTNIQDEAQGENLVIVGMGEAGIEVASELARQGQRVTIVDESPEPVDASNDPSRVLSPISSQKLARNKDQVQVLRNCQCIGTFTDDSGLHNAKIQMNTGVPTDAVQTLQSKSRIVLCTGFDVQQSPVLNGMVLWKDGYPILTAECDESTKVPNFFVCGPMVRHASKACSTDSSLKSDKDIIFCFIYKFRTRFPLVAAEVLCRVVHDRHCSHTMDGNVVIDPVGQEILSSVEKMQSFYRKKGMLVDNLSCPGLSCPVPGSGETASVLHI